MESICKEYAPVLVTVYNRKKHFSDCIDSLKKNHLAKETILYIASDYSSRKEDEQAVAEEIKNSGADMLFLGITSPKKELFLDKFTEYMGVPFSMGVGGTFDIVSGKTKRAPLWMQKCGLEWFYRVLQEPRRLWKRFLVTNTLFILLVIKELFKRK